MIRVLHVYKDYPPIVGGIERHVRLLTQGLAATGEVQPSVLVCNTVPRTVVEQDGPVKIIKACRLATVASTPLSIALLQKIAEIEANLAHLHFPYPWGELAYLWRGHSRKLVLTYHSDIVRQRKLLWLYGPFLRRLLVRADRIIVGSPNYLRSSQFLQSVREKCSIIPFGIDVDRSAEPCPDQATLLRQRFGEALILFVGRFRYYKGLSYLVEAMQSIEGKLVLVGSGPEEMRLRQQVDRLGLQSKIIFAGEVADEELPAYYQAASVFVLPAVERSEAFGLAQLEALANGVPVVCTELGTGTTYVNRAGETGLIVPPRDPVALAAAVNRLLSDEPLCQQLGWQARRWVRSAFTLDAMVKATLQLYREVLGGALPSRQAGA